MSIQSPHKKWKVFWAESSLDYRKECEDIFGQNNCEVMFTPLDMPGPLFEDELVKRAIDVDAILLANTKITRRVLDELKKLKVIVKAGVGVDNIDVPAATNNGILVANTPVPADYVGVAEGAVARILALVKHLQFSDWSVKQGLWARDYSKLKGVYLKNRVTIGIFGLGRIGSHVAKLMKPWNVKLIAHDPHIQPEKAELLDIEMVSFERLLSHSDVLTIHAVLTPETKHIINANALEKMKKTAYIVNTARGAIIDQNDLYEALNSGRIAGAALDVFEEEPVVGSLLSPGIADKLLLSPHSSGLSDNMLREIAFGMVAQCVDASRGQLPKFTLNMDGLSKWRERFAEVEL